MKDAAFYSPDNNYAAKNYSDLNIRGGKVMDEEGDPVGSDLSFITHRVWFI